MEILPDKLSSQLLSLPDAPGVYVFKNKLGEAIYIGKASSLKARVKSYFNDIAWKERPKLAVMMPKVNLVETIVVNSEKEALLLEATLVRRHMPRYNVTLKDDKRYPWLAITCDEKFPRLTMIRDPAKYRHAHPKAKIFGPYVECGAMWETVKLLRRIFPLRQRKKPLFKDRPCMNYYIKLCMAPCQNLVSEEFYNQMVEQVVLFLSGRQKEALAGMEKEMKAASATLRFEEAAKLRDKIFALRSVVEKQQVFSPDYRVSQDIIAEAHTDKIIIMCLMRIREGKLVSSELFDLLLADHTCYDEAFQSFIEQYYVECEEISLPKEILLQHNIEDVSLVSEILSSRAGCRIRMLLPQRGVKKKLMEMACKNANLALAKYVKDKNSETLLYATSPLPSEVLSKLKEELQLKRIPSWIECFDVSNIQGTDNVASLVVFEEGKPKKAAYRHFKIKSCEGEPNDFASIKEAVKRRYLRLIKENGPLPDLVIVDGGKGQLSAALSALAELGVPEIDAIGLAKKQEEIYLPFAEKPIALSLHNDCLRLLQRIRNEAHRFAITFHRKLRAKRTLGSRLDNLPLVGVVRRKALLKHFGSLADIKNASLEELETVPGIPKMVAKNIYQLLRNDHYAVLGKSKNEH